ncbi:hypothetical protein ASB62_07520 [Chlorobium limicola]|uniref:Uncharacterized protein n=1 Tax=Chlorobium limicola TaxID=1092 RepID=A0A101J9P7_CHLLI|nr:hypothetical protein ASB62_07520 [Chlorobium limicola]
MLKYEEVVFPGFEERFRASIFSCYFFSSLFLRAGCDSPPAVFRRYIRRARERFRCEAEGQQIWCKTKADGHSPDERERERRYGVPAP